MSGALQRTGGTAHIKRLRDTTGIITADESRMLNITQTFFTNLYSPPVSPANYDTAQALLLAPLRAALIQAGFNPLPTQHGEIVHLGHPIHTRGAGSPCIIGFNDRIDAIGARIPLIRKFGSDLITRIRLSNSILTPKLWHATAIGGLPITARTDVSLALRKFLYLGDTPWFETANISAPLHLGGLGFIHPDHMFTAQSITYLAHNLLRPDEYGTWLQEGLAWHLHHVYHCSPAALLIPNGVHRARLTADTTRAAGFWGRLLHALASVDLSLDPSWPDLGGPALLELPWYFDSAIARTPKPWPLSRYRSAATRGWITWGDILWKSTLATRDRTHASSWPLGPPSPRAAAANLIPRANDIRDPKGPELGTIFAPYWASLPPDFRQKLIQTTDMPLATGVDPSLPVPRIRDPSARAFPWHLLQVNTKPLQQATTRSTRLALGRTTTITVRWPSAMLHLPNNGPPDPLLPPNMESSSEPLPPAPDTAAWGTAWTELHRTPLPSPAVANCFLSMHRRAWLALDGKKTHQCTLPGCDKHDSQEHAYLTCSAITPLWSAALPVLRMMGITAPIPLAPHLVALAWPTIRRFRPRLVLWRTIIIHLITEARHPALAHLKRTGTFVPTAPNPELFRLKVERLLAESITTARARCRARQRSTNSKNTPTDTFTSTWISGSTLVYADETGGDPTSRHFLLFPARSPSKDPQGRSRFTERVTD
ncbi:unnamed protein product [Tilletia caries]|nr:unnamed protein product [Tilletia caries]